MRRESNGRVSQPPSLEAQLRMTVAEVSLTP